MLNRRNHLSEEDRSLFWEHVTFCNFLQHYLPSGNTPPYEGNEPLYDAAIPSLLELINSLPSPPQVIYVWSKAVLDCLMANIEKFQDLKFESLEKYPQVMELYLMSLATPIPYSLSWVKCYLDQHLKNGSCLCPSNMPQLAEVLCEALAKDFLRAQDNKIVIPYYTQTGRSAQYGCFLSTIHKYYNMKWKQIENIIFKLNKTGGYQRQNLRSLETLSSGDTGYDFVMAFFKKNDLESQQ